MVRDRDTRHGRVLLSAADSRLHPYNVVQGIFPSPNGRYLAYRISRENRDDAMVQVLDVDSGKSIITAIGGESLWFSIMDFR